MMISIHGIGCGSGALLELPLPGGCETGGPPLFSQVGAALFLPGAMAPADWTGGYSEYSLGNAGRYLPVKGALPRGEPIRGTVGRATNGSLIITVRKYTVSLEYAEGCNEGLEFLRGLQGNWRGFRFWLVTDGGRLIGGPLGIKPAYVDAGVAYPSGRGSFEAGYLEIEWYAPNDGATAYVPEMIGGGEGGEPPAPPEIQCEMYSQYFTGAMSAVLTYTANGGSIPSGPNTRVWVFQNGQRLNPVIGQYSVTPNTAPGESTISISALTHFDGSDYAVFVFS